MTNERSADRPARYHLGIDLGTTYTGAAVARHGRVEIVTLGDRAAVVPSVLFLRDDGDVLTGDAAQRRGLGDPTRVVKEFKRRVGDPTPVMIGASPYSTDALMAHLLGQVVAAATERQGAEPAGIAITHPANWGPFKLDVLHQAVRMADLDAATLLSEPEAAAIHYASLERLDPGECVAVYDLGGGTFDAAVLRKTETGFEILGDAEGIERLGGVDFDEAVFRHVMRWAEPALSDLDPDEPAVLQAVARLRQECVDAKEALSSDTDVSIPILLPNLQTEVRLTRAEFESMIRPILGQTIDALHRALRNAAVSPEELRAVLLVGGSSRIPLVAQLVGAELGRPVAVDVHPKHTVALGAAIAAANGDAMVSGKNDRSAGARAGAAEETERPTVPAQARVGAGVTTGGTGHAAPADVRSGSSTPDMFTANRAGVPETPQRVGSAPSHEQSQANVVEGRDGRGAGANPNRHPAAPSGWDPAQPMPAPKATSGESSVPRLALVLGAVGLMLVVAVGAFALNRGDSTDGDGTGADAAALDASDVAPDRPGDEGVSGADTDDSGSLEVLDAGVAAPSDASSGATTPEVDGFDVDSSPSTSLATTATTAPAASTTVPSSTTVVSTTIAAEPAGMDVTVDSITVADGRYVVAYTTNYEALISSEPGAVHIHFFFDTVPITEAGVPGSGPWKLYDGPQPFAEYSVADTPAGATALCATAADHTHAVVDPSRFHCLELPAG